jgi:hypothetical protein
VHPQIIAMVSVSEWMKSHEPLLLMVNQLSSINQVTGSVFAVSSVEDVVGSGLPRLIASVLSSARIRHMRTIGLFVFTRKGLASIYTS